MSRLWNRMSFLDPGLRLYVLCLRGLVVRSAFMADLRFEVSGGRNRLRRYEQNGRKQCSNLY